MLVSPRGHTISRLTKAAIGSLELGLSLVAADSADSVMA